MDCCLPQNPPKLNATIKVNAWSIEKTLSCSWRWEEQRYIGGDKQKGEERD